MAAAALTLVPELSAHLVPARRLEERRTFLPTGLDALDALLGGGWPRGALSEVAGDPGRGRRSPGARRSSGRTSVLYRSLAAAQARGEVVALCDAGGMLDPRAAEHAGIDLDRLLWVRCGGKELLQATDLLVAAGGFGLVALDLGEAPPRVPTASWVRLGRGAERQGMVVLCSTPWRLAGTFAAAAVVLEGRAARFDGRGGAPRLFLGIETSAALLRARQADGPPPAESPRLWFPL